MGIYLRRGTQLSLSLEEDIIEPENLMAHILRVLWTARRSNLSILKEINPEYSLEGQMLKLKLQYFGHLMKRTDSLEKTLMLGKIESRREATMGHVLGAEITLVNKTSKIPS